MSSDQPPAADGDLVALFQSRDGQATEVVLRDGQRLIVFNIAWGYDIADEYAHVTTNVSPDVEGATIDFFFNDDVVKVIDPGSGAILFETA